MTQFQAVDSKQELVYYWAIGDLHYRALQPWHEFHSKRMAAMFDDLHSLWQTEGRPAFCVSPGDIVETCAQENYDLAQEALSAQLTDLPFYPGIGNHEYYGPEGEDPEHMDETFSRVWNRPLRYSWEVGQVGYIMLDYPNPSTLENPERVYLSTETLGFLDDTLEGYKDRPVVIFLHCPLRDTVLDRDVEKHRDYNSRQSFFSPENSQQVRDILARRGNACLFLSGHTHTGWEAPNLVVTERFGKQTVTFINLMSPWYTGTHTGPHISDDHKNFAYRADEPDVIPSFAFRIYPDHANIRIREHRTQQWLKEWDVPLRSNKG